MILRAEVSKFGSLVWVWILLGITPLATWPMAVSNATPLPEGMSLDESMLYSSIPVPLEYRGFEMAGFGYVLVVVVAALWAGSEYGAGKQLRTTFLAMPRRSAVFAVKTLVLAVVVGVVGFITMGGTIMITHLVAGTGIAWTLSAPIWTHVSGVTFAWVCVAVITFAIGTLTRSAIWPLALVLPFVIGLADFFATLWRGAAFLPIAAGAALYSDPRSGIHLSPSAGVVVLSAWVAVFLATASFVFTRRDLS